jgi:hypothetical protein
VCECVFVVLVSQHARRKRHIILLSDLFGSAVFSFHYLKNGMIFGTVIESKNARFDFLYNFKTFLILRRTERDTMINLQRSTCK